MSFWKKDNLEENSENTKNITISLDGNSLDENANEAKALASASSFSKEEALAPSSSMRSALSAGTVIQGKLSFDTPVSIDGKLSGELFSSETVVIGKSGVVDAQIEVRSLVIAGKVTGNIKVTEKASILSGAKVDGSLSAPLLSVEEGAVLNCKFQMTNNNNNSLKSENLRKR